MIGRTADSFITRPATRLAASRSLGLGITRLPHISNISYRRGGAPGPLFLTLGFPEPRGSVRFGLGGRLARAARFIFLRSALSLIFLVSISVLIAP